MQYGQIVFLLFVAMVFYYAAMIFMDFQRAKAAQNAEQDSHKEEDIDISEEARSFKPIRINRDGPESKEENQEENNIENPGAENEKCELYVLYRSKKNTDGSWYISEAEILDIFAYSMSTKDVVSSGKTSWSATRSEEYYEIN